MMPERKNLVTSRCFETTASSRAIHARLKRLSSPFLAFNYCLRVHHTCVPRRPTCSPIHHFFTSFCFGAFLPPRQSLEDTRVILALTNVCARAFPESTLTLSVLAPRANSLAASLGRGYRL